MTVLTARPVDVEHDKALEAIRNWAPNARQAFVIERTKRALADRVAYTKALTLPTGYGGFETCIAIEQRWGLFGFAPEFVSAGLNAACEGKDAVAAADAAWRVARSAS